VLFQHDEVKVALMIADKLSKPLYEIRPDLLPYGRITRLEVELWALHLNERTKNGD
jgi:hypothetical protein